MSDTTSGRSVPALLREIASTARAHDGRWDVSRMAELLELYGAYLRAYAERDAPSPPVSFEVFVADEALCRATARARESR